MTIFQWKILPSSILWLLVFHIWLQSIALFSIIYGLLSFYPSGPFDLLSFDDLFFYLMSFDFLSQIRGTTTDSYTNTLYNAWIYCILLISTRMLLYDCCYFSFLIESFTWVVVSPISNYPGSLELWAQKRVKCQPLSGKEQLTRFRG